MNGRRKKVFLRVSATHFGVLFLLLVVPWIKGCIHPKPKEIITFIDLAAPPPAPEMTAEPEEEPVVPKKPEPKKEPIPKPKPKPEPVKTNTPPKVVKKEEKPKPAPKKEVPKPEPKPVVKKEPPKPVPKPAPKPVPKKTEAERLAAIRQNRPVITKPSPSTKPSPQTDFTRLKSALESAAAGSGSSGSGSGSGGSGVYSPFAGYYNSIKDRLYAVWQQPSGSPIGLSAEATIYVERDGRVSSKRITRRSGNVSFDQSVQNALNATTFLPAPPAGLPSRTITVAFEIAR